MNVFDVARQRIYHRLAHLPKPPLSDMPSPNYDADLDEFLTRKGAAHVAFRIVAEGASFSELEEDTGLSPATLSKRLKHGEQLGLWTTTAARAREGGRSNQKYVPTERGKELFRLMTSTGFARALVSHKAHQDEYEERKTALIETVRKQLDEGELAPPWEEPPEAEAEALESVHGLDRAPDPDVDIEVINTLSNIDLSELSENEMRTILRLLSENDLDTKDIAELLEEPIDESSD